MKNLMKKIEIETAENGYIARAAAEMHFAPGAPYVFESFQSLTDWLSETLEKPRDMQGGSATEPGTAN